ncbi:MAG TPA: hypothetical protein DDW49_08415 [Deltaproteobacteria bacterium]|nr:MAG: hypothetical protein A2048_08030 [Deltaproteobacteria bacterium GWA2_45_12]HBF13388.1 hypothetical protein [Deltaproteobacteria bacterium]
MQRNFSWILILLLSLSLVAAKKEKKGKNIPPPSKEKAMEYYQAHQFDASLLEFLRLGQNLDEQSQYTLALSYAQKQMPGEAANTLKPLFEKDAAYMTYRVHYDNDLASVRTMPVFKDLITPLEVPFLLTDEQTGDRLAATSEGLYLFRHGQKIPLKELKDAKFEVYRPNSDLLLYLWNQTLVNETSLEPATKTFSGINLYSCEKKEGMNLYQGEGPVGPFYPSSIGDKTAVIYQIPGKIIVIAVGGAFGMSPLAQFDGQIVSVDTNMGAVDYDEPTGKKDEKVRKQFVLSQVLGLSN